MSDDYLWDRSGPPDPRIAELEQLLAPLGHDAPLDELRVRASVRRPRRAMWIVVGGALAAAAAVIAIVLARSGDRAPATTIATASSCVGSVGFAFTSRGGQASCGGAELATGVLPVGGSLDTGAHEADLTIANIGAAELGPHTRVHLAHLAQTSASQHQLVLDVGHLHARVNAPPRLFIVDTASTRVTDLGCEYTIDVDANGAGAIAVQVGQVELATKSGAVVLAPSLTRTSIRAGREPGIPLRDRADDALAAAVHAYERDAPDAPDALAAFRAVLAAATDADAISILALVAIDAPHRAEALARLAVLAPPPDGVTVESALRVPADLAAWHDDIVATYFRGGTPSKHK